MFFSRSFFQMKKDTYLMGIGTSSKSTLSFKLPPHAESFETALGLDSSVGKGGCLSAQIALDGVPLFVTQALRGNESFFQTGRLSVKGGKVLDLSTDPTPADCPKGADPFDIRDALNWYEPTLHLSSDAFPFLKK
jgi:hypothetical protein